MNSFGKYKKIKVTSILSHTIFFYTSNLAKNEFDDVI